MITQGSPEKWMEVGSQVMGYIEGLNNKIRVLQKKAYGIRDEKYTKFKIVNAGLPKL